MKLLITGATGFIGFKLALEARAHGYRVVLTGLSNNATEEQRRRELETAGMQMLAGMLQDRRFAAQLVEGCDAVIHLAAAQHEAGVPDEYFHSANVEATRVLLDAAANAGVKRFVYGSTIGVYGSTGAMALDEESPPQPQNIYGVTKLAAEKLVIASADCMDISIVRISEVYGPGDRRLLKLFKAAEGGFIPIIGAGRNLRQPIHVHDLARGLLKVLEHPAARGQTFVLAGPAPMTTRQMIDTVAGSMQQRAQCVHVPLAPLRAGAALLERVCEPLGIQPPLHRRRLDFFIKSFWFSTEKAKRLLGFEATIPFATGARDTVSWYRNTGLLRPVRAASALPEHRSAPTPATTADVPLAAFSGGHMDLSQILEYTHDAVIIWEMDGAGILYWNRAAEQLYGYSRQQAQGRITHLLLHTQLQGGVDHLESELCRYGVWLGNLRHRRQNGTIVIVNARLALMAQRNGRWLVLEINRELATAQSSHAAPWRTQVHSSETGDRGS